MFVWYKDTNSGEESYWEGEFAGKPNYVLEYLKVGKSIRIRYFCDLEEEAEQLKGKYGGGVRAVEDEEWNKPVDAPRPVNVRGKILLTSVTGECELEEMRKGQVGKHIISIPAEMAFGTGDHATTSTCLRMLVDVASERKRMRKAWSMADLGTGTGVLAIAAKHLGASELYACDFDPFAVAAAKRNAVRNGAEGIDIQEQDVLVWEPRVGGYDLVMANLFSTVLIEAWPVIAKSIAVGGDLIVSGILADQAWDVFTAAATHGIGISKVVRKGKWVTARGGLMVDLIKKEGLE